MPGPETDILDPKSDAPFNPKLNPKPSKQPTAGATKVYARSKERFRVKLGCKKGVGLRAQEPVHKGLNMRAREVVAEEWGLSGHREAANTVASKGKFPATLPDTASADR